MSDYTKTTNFAAKDSLPSGNSGKIVKGSEIDTEFNNIQTAVATKANANNAALTGTTTVQTLDISGNVDVDGTLETDALSLNGVTVTSTAAELNILDGVTATTAELNYVDGVTSNVQTQLNTKAPLASPTFTGTVTAAGLEVEAAAPVFEINSTTTSNTATMQFTSSGTVDSKITHVGNTGVMTIDSGRNSSWGGKIAFVTDTEERMRIDASGNLLVGKTSTGSSVVGQELRANGYNVFTRDGDTPLELYRKTSDGSLLNFTKDGTVVGSIGTLSGDLNIGSGDTGLDFSAGLDAIMPYDPSTNNLRDNTLDLGQSAARFKDIYLSSAVKFGSQDALTTDGTSNYLKSGSAIYFQPSNSQKMLLDSTGKLLLGTTGTSFNERLTVNSDSAPYSAHLFAGSGATAPLICRNANGVSGSRSQIIFYYDANASGSITSTSSATAYNTSSDQRLKSNIADADDAGSKVDAIQVRKFDWIADGSHQDYGMIAQELQSVAPEAVSGDADSDEMMGVDYSKLVPMLVKEIQSLRTRVQELENN